MSDIIGQWLDPAALHVDLHDLDRRGVSFRAAQIVGGVRLGRNGWWVLPVFVDPPSIYRMVDEPVLLDFVRFDPDAPTRWEAVYGSGVMLGEAAFMEARLHRLPLPIFRTPLGWVQAAGAGVFPIDAEAFAREALMCPPVELHPEDLDHGRDLYDLMQQANNATMPRIMVPV